MSDRDPIRDPIRDPPDCGADVAAYVLGALDPDETRSFVRHLERCVVCRDEVASLAPVIDALPASAPPRPVPAALRRRTWLGLPRFAPIAIAALLLIGVAIGIGVTQLGGSGERTVQAQVLDKARAPHASAEVEVSSDGATLVAHGLPAPPSGRVYQVWLKRAGHAPEPTSALFTPRRDGTATATVPGSLSGVDQMLVTDEPSGGSQQPTTSPLLAATVS